MLDNKRNGRGTYVHVNNGWYKGDFKNDMKNKKVFLCCEISKKKKMFAEIFLFMKKEF